MKKQTNGKDPAVLLYTQDFLVGTYNWSIEQRGMYITLLCLQHQKLNKLTLNDLKIADGDELVLEKFPLHSDGYYYNHRMYMEIENRKVRTDASRKNGMLGGRPKKVTKQKPMGSSLDNLKETYNKPKNNLAEDGNENEIVNEDKTVNVSYKLLDKCFDKLLDVTTFKQGYNELLEDFGTIDNALNQYTDDESVKSNWIRQINNKIDILA